MKIQFIYRLPETPIDTPEDNALLRMDGLPRFDQLTPEKCWTGIGKLALEYESKVWAVEEMARSEYATEFKVLHFFLLYFC